MLSISLLSYWYMVTGSFMWSHLFFTARAIIRSNKHSKVMCQRCHIAHRKTKQLNMGKYKSPDSLLIISCKISILQLAQWYYAPAELHQDIKGFATLNYNNLKKLALIISVLISRFSKMGIIFKSLAALLNSFKTFKFQAQKVADFPTLNCPHENSFVLKIYIWAEK